MSYQDLSVKPWGDTRCVCAMRNRVSVLGNTSAPIKNNQTGVGAKVSALPDFE